ncbi:probable helicase with zinc finger domain isoform X2 [Neocloeon triangulifer]|uniref:probable helicase with zinc finger domain isoform X2 n=1 Tax=Neocloeon triangulifer TaxID=2078957 RepID=UPI00286F3F12|nr:probable helicase with zinc finger domain isoform X2 [Neocloeon triangulifer]
MSKKSENVSVRGAGDDESKWRWRPPPRGVGADAYTLCDAWKNGGTCRYGVQCVEAHGQDELDEWRCRFEERKARLATSTYTEGLLEKWNSSDEKSEVISEQLPAGVASLTCEDLANVVAANKHSKTQWTISAQSLGKTRLKVVALLQDNCREQFRLTEIQIRSGNGTAHTWRPNTNQDWKVPDSAYKGLKADAKVHYKIKVQFSTEIYGTFRQSIVFDFGTFPVTVKHVSVEVVPGPNKSEEGDAVEGDPEEEQERLAEVRSLVVSSAGRWVDGINASVIPFFSDAYKCLPLTQQPRYMPSDSDKKLLATYPVPQANEFPFTDAVMERAITMTNYIERLHQLLFIEELARYDLVSHFNVEVKLHLASSYLLATTSAPGSGGGGGGTAKYAPPGELYAHLALSKDISEDTCSGRLILNNCTSIFISSASEKEKMDKDTKRTVYEAVIEDKGKNVVYLRLSSDLVKYYNLKADMDFPADVQFQLNRVPFCEWHYSVDQMKPNVSLVFPETTKHPSIPWNPQRQWNDSLDSRLNPKQREAVIAITTPVETPLPPILLIGPFGTGKTYTLAQGIKQILLQPNTRVLVCTHSNSAADLYIKDYLHPYVLDGHEEARPLRIYFTQRWVTTVHQTVQKYCLINVSETERTFRSPTEEDIMRHRVIVVTLSISTYLSSMGLKKGHFTHILLDEAAQAMECEAIMPLAIADENTRIVLAGDHMQLSPEVHSPFAREKGLHFSLLERLYDHYPSTFPCKILLCENYRAHEAIIQFTSELFYDQKLISSGNQPRHEKLYPLTFYTTRGEDIQETNSTAFYNNAEVYELVERVADLRKKWPKEWGRLDEHSIGVMTPYADQVFRIRAELRKRRMGGVSVERVLNIQGKQFRAVFLSTVRTRSTCKPGAKEASAEDMDYGFLSNSKLLNTAITRAQSLVAVVGDPVALCSIGRCRKVWEKFINVCHQNRSLFGITWAALRAQLDGVEMRSTYTLNPLAPEFVPRRLQTESSAPASQAPAAFAGANLNYNQQVPVHPQNIYPQMFFMPPPVVMQHPMMYPPNWKARAVPSPPPKAPLIRPQPTPYYPPYAGQQPRIPMVPGMRPPQILPPAMPPQAMPPLQPPPPPVVPSAQPRMFPERPNSLNHESEQPKQIQFLHNVHFPERHPSPATNTNNWDSNVTNQMMAEKNIPPNMDPRRGYPPSPQQPPMRPQSHQGPPPQNSAGHSRISPFQNLLPPNITLETMLKNTAMQYDWHKTLVENCGPDAGAKFVEMIVAANNYKQKTTAPVKPEPKMVQSQMMGPPVMQQPPHYSQQQATSPQMVSPQSAMHHSLNHHHNLLPPHQSMQQQQQLSPGTQLMQNEVVEDVVRSLDKLLASSSIAEKAKYLGMPDRIPLPPQFEQNMVNRPSMAPHKMQPDIMNGHSSNHFEPINIFSDDLIPLPADFIRRENERMQGYPQAHENPLTQSRLFNLQHKEEMPGNRANWMNSSAMMQQNGPRLSRLETTYSPTPERIAERMYRSQSPPHPDHEQPTGNSEMMEQAPPPTLSYASVLRQKPQPTTPTMGLNKSLLDDPFAVLRELGTRSASQLQSNNNLPYRPYNHN